MRECVQCLIDVAEESWAACPTCGGPLKDLPVSSQALASPSFSAPRRARVHEAAALPTPFIGRKKKLAALRDYLRNPGTPWPSRVHVVGAAGIGKTRFVQEALKDLPDTCEPIWWTCPPLGKSMGLVTVINWLRQEMKLPPIHNAKMLSGAIRDYLAGRIPESEANPVLLLEHLFGLPDALKTLREAPPRQVLDNLFALIQQLIARPAAEGSRRVLIIDEMQHADPVTLDLVQKLALGVRDHGLKLVLIHEKENGSPPVTDDCLLLRLAPLGGEDHHELLSHLLLTEEFLPEIRKYILDRSAGNPLFLEEMIQLVRQEMQAYPELNGKPLVNHIVEIIPVSLEEIISRRVARLNAQARRVLNCASLLGYPLSLDVYFMLDVIGENLEAQFKVLQSQHFLERHEETGGEGLGFSHSLHRQAAYDLFDERERRAMHEHLAGRMETALAGLLPGHYETLAYHFSRGGNPAKARYYLVKSADREYRLGEFANAREAYHEALALIEGLEASPANLVLASRLLIQCGLIAHSLGEVEEAREILIDALSHAVDSGNPLLQLEARLRIAILRLWSGEAAEILPEFEKLLEETGLSQAPHLEVLTLNALGVLHWQKGQHKKALRAYQNLARLAERCGAPHFVADAMNNAGLIYWGWGQLVQALKAFKRALALRRKVADRLGYCATLANIAIIQEELGKIHVARQIYERVIELADQLGAVRVQAAGETNYSNLLRRMGLNAGALEHALKGLHWTEMIVDPHLAAVARINLGLAYAALCDFPNAQDHLKKALVQSRERGYKEQEVSARLWLLEFSLEQHPPTGAQLDELDLLLRQIVETQLHNLQPRAWRLKGLILVELGASEAEITDCMDRSLSTARKLGKLFDALETLRVYVKWAQQKVSVDKVEHLSKELYVLTDLINPQ